ncbi:MAG: PEGA domain-containing protein [Bryobacterales bacterium]|nr:PEGA domain-containing protein [Bryobacterales bacterium]
MLVLLALLSLLAYSQPLFRATPDLPLAIDETTLAYHFDEDAGLHRVRFQVALDGPDALQIAFGDFHLPAGAAVRLFALAADGTVSSAGPYEAAGPAGTGEFWSDPVAGNPVTVELSSPEPLATLPFSIAGVSPGEFAAPPPAAAPAPSPDVWEGDILVDWWDKRLRSGVSVPTVGEYVWPDGVIPYSIAAGLPSQQRITSAISHWNGQLNGTLRLVPRSNERVYVQFVRPPSAGVCASYVGWMGMAAQPVQIGDQCSTGNVIHEIGHVAGLFHEHTRAGRDRHVRVLDENIQSDAAVNFAIVPGSVEQGDYDFGSIMHYGAYAFSANGLPTLVTIPEGISIGQRAGLSAGDIAAVRALYGSRSGPATTGGNTPSPTLPPTPSGPSTVTVTIASNPPGRTVTVDGTLLTTPARLSWTPGSRHTVAASSESTGAAEYTFTKWSDGGAASHTVTATGSATTLTATYAMRYRLTTDVRGDGTLTVRPAAPNGMYTAGSTISLNAQPGAGSCFAGWLGTIPVTAPAASMVLGKPYDVVAQFQPGAVTVPSSFGVPAGGGTFSVGVAATSGCIWSAVTNGSWISIGTPYGSSSGVMRVTVRPNTSGVARMAMIAVNGKAMVVQQSGR